MTTQGYTLIDAPEPKQKLVHVHADARELGRVFRPTLAIHSGMAQFTAAAAAVSVNGSVGASGRRTPAGTSRRTRRPVPTMGTWTWAM